MRTLAVTVLTGLAALVVAGSASAIPSLSLVWSGSTGTGATGGSSIAAAVGDTLSLDVVLTIDPTGFTGAQFDLLGSGGLTAASNTLIAGAGGPPECPTPPNLAPGTCFSSTFKSFTPLMAGVTDAGSSTVNYDMAGLTPEFVPQTMTIGRGKFIVSASGTVVLGFGGNPVGGAATDGSFVGHGGLTGTATAIVPEPGTAALMGLGLAALGVAGRRRS
jgi:hypothetical protein